MLNVHDFNYSNFSQYYQTLHEAAMLGDSDKVPEYRECFWYSLDEFPRSYNKGRKQEAFYRHGGAGCRYFTLREIADMHGRVIRRFVSAEVKELDDFQAVQATSARSRRYSPKPAKSA